jgi:hypothetical protein
MFFENRLNKINTGVNMPNQLPMVSTMPDDLIITTSKRTFRGSDFQYIKYDESKKNWYLMLRHDFANIEEKEFNEIMLIFKKLKYRYL